MTLHLQGEFAWVEKRGKWMPVESMCWREYRERNWSPTLGSLSGVLSAHT